MDIESTYDVIIIGAGVGGLTAGVFLAKAGKKVLIIEQHTSVGGYATSFERNGFIFDVGPQLITFKTHIEPMLRALNLSKDDFPKLLPIETPFTFVIDNDVINLSSNKVECIEEIKNIFLKEAKNIDDFFVKMEDSFKNGARLVGEITVPVTSETVRYFSLLRTPIKQYLNAFDNENLKNLLTFWWDQEIPALLVAGFWYYLFNKDFYRPAMGMSVIPRFLTKHFQNYGGSVLLNVLVTKILIRDNIAYGVKLSDGSCIFAKHVISNADCKNTYLNLVGKEYLKSDFINKIEQLEVSDSFFSVYLGIKGDVSNFQKYKGFQIYYLPDRITKWKYSRIFNNKTSVINICIPSLIDSSLAPPECYILIIRVASSYSEWANFNLNSELGKREYKNLKDEIGLQLLQIAKEIIPISSTHILTKEIATPLTFKRFTLNTNGAATAWSSKQFAYQFFVTEKTPIQNLYLAGHWALGGGVAGIPSAMFSGYRVAMNILGKIKL